MIAKPRIFLCGPLRSLRQKSYFNAEIAEDTQSLRRETKRAARAARLPAAAPTIRFSRIPNLYFQYVRLSRKISKKISGTSLSLFQNPKRSTLLCFI
jgi:hypothetical protein